MQKLLSIAILFIALTTSCNTKMEKPFIIVNKSYHQNPLEDKVYFEYTYQESSKEGHKVTFTDINNYEIGDTLK